MPTLFSVMFRAVFAVAALFGAQALVVVSAEEGRPAGAGRAPGVAWQEQQSAARDVVNRLDGRRMRDKVAAIESRANALTGPPSPGRTPSVPAAAAPASTVVTEREVNSYLAFEAGSQVPVGIAEPRIAILGDRRLAGSALVDLDAVRAQRKATGWLDPMSYLSGRLPVTVSGRLNTAGGIAQFELESAKISGVPIPKTVLQELLTYYSRTPANPRGLNLDDSFQLPARIRQIDVRRGEAVVIQ